MMRFLATPTLTILLVVLAAASPAPAGPLPVEHVTAEVVSVDAVNRTLVVSIAGGPPQTVELDDAVAGLGDLKAGDRAILTLRKEPGRPRVAALIRAKDRKLDGKNEAASANPVLLPSASAGDAEAAGRAFAERTAALAEEANRVDRIWRSFRESCDVKLATPYEGAREWFSLWDNQARADLSSGACRDLFDQIVSAGSDVTRSMVTAEDAARRSLLPGSIRDIRRRYSMDWDGWGRPAPAKLER
jgi:hypothetical protein